MVFKWHDWHVPKFLERFEAYECLWNTESNSYKDRKQRDNAIRSLKEDLNIHGVTEQDIKLKIKSIRTRYSHELAKIKKSTNSCNSMDEVYVPKLFWFTQADTFLNAVYTARNSLSNLGIEDKVESQRENNNSDSNPNEEIKPVNIRFNEKLFHGAVGGYSYNLDRKNNNENSGSDPLISEESLHQETIGGHSTSSTSQAPRHFKRAKKRLNDLLINRAIKQLKEINDANNKEDEFDLFCRSLAFQLKAMPIQRALLCQEKLQSVMVQERLKSMVVDSPAYAEVMSTSRSTSS